MVQKIHPRGVIGVPNSGPYVKRFQIRVLLSEGSILEPSLVKDTKKEKLDLKNLCIKKNSARFQLENWSAQLRSTLLDSENLSSNSSLHAARIGNNVSGPS